MAVPDICSVFMATGLFAKYCGILQHADLINLPITDKNKLLLYIVKQKLPIATVQGCLERYNDFYHTIITYITSTAILIVAHFLKDATSKYRRTKRMI